MQSRVKHRYSLGLRWQALATSIKLRPTRSSTRPHNGGSGCGPDKAVPNERLPLSQKASARVQASKLPALSELRLLRSPSVCAVAQARRNDVLSPQARVVNCFACIAWSQTAFFSPPCRASNPTSGTPNDRARMRPISHIHGCRGVEKTGTKG